VSRLGIILEGLPASSLRMRAAAMRKHWRRFTYNEDDGYTTDDVPDDAFHSIMEILSLRRVPRYRPVASFEPPIM
jgi:hypothetical protein